MGALVLLPPLPPEPAVVRRAGQQCFWFLDINFVVHDSRPKKQSRPRRKRRPSNKRFGRWQYRIPFFEYTYKRKPRPFRKNRLRVDEKKQLDQDVSELAAAGAYAARPVRGNGVSGDCPTGPCPFAHCKFSLLVHIRRKGSVKEVWPDIDAASETCALRFAERVFRRGHQASFEEVGEAMNITPQMVDVVNASAERNFAAAWARMYPDDPPPRFGKE